MYKPPSKTPVMKSHDQISFLGASRILRGFFIFVQKFSKNLDSKILGYPGTDFGGFLFMMESIFRVIAENRFALFSPIVFLIRIVYADNIIYFCKRRIRVRKRTASGMTQNRLFVFCQKFGALIEFDFFASLEIS